MALRISRKRRFSRRRNLPIPHLTLAPDKLVFPGFFGLCARRLGCRLGKLPPAWACSAPVFPHLLFAGNVAETLYFRLLAHVPYPLPLGANGSQDVPREPVTCLIGTQHQWLAPRNSGVASGVAVPANRSADPTAYWNLRQNSQVHIYKILHLLSK